MKRIIQLSNSICLHCYTSALFSLAEEIDQLTFRHKKRQQRSLLSSRRLLDKQYHDVNSFWIFVSSFRKSIVKEECTTGLYYVCSRDCSITEASMPISYQNLQEYDSYSVQSLFETNLWLVQENKFKSDHHLDLQKLLVSGTFGIVVRVSHYNIL